MPTYQYRCQDCSNDLEVVQKFTDDALTECPSCQGSLRKVYGAVGVVFKGSGFYATDNRSKPSGPANGADKATKGDKEGKAASPGKEGKDGKGKDPASAPATKSTSSGSKSTKPATASSGG